MAVPSRTRLGPYEVLAPIGTGGMGEVYRGRDTRLGRSVAIKILPARLADSERRERFEREARAVSALSHPHICSLYDVGEQDGTNYLVMEYLEGETLAARIAKGPLSRESLFVYAVQICQALAHAHHEGVLHRDLKPSNIMITRDGVKLLDFGLAKLSQPMQVLDPRSEQTTMSCELTQKGVIVGTLPYMAPEQLEGRSNDARTDIFSFGAVIYEMAAGRRAFPGQSAASVIAAILEHEPPSLANGDWQTALNRIVHKCLAKAPAERWQTAQDLSTVLEWIGENAFRPTEHAETGLGRRLRVMWISAAALAVALLVLALVILTTRRPLPQVHRMQFTVPPPDGTVLTPAPPAISPDGSLLAFLAAKEGRSMVWMRPIDSVAARPLPGTDLASAMFWSPDSRSLAFVAEGKLNKIEISSGAVSNVTSVASGPHSGNAASSNSRGAWNRDEIILLPIAYGRPLHRVPAAGGVAVPVTSIDQSRGDFGHGWPQWLPDNRSFLYFVRTSNLETTGIYRGTLEPAGAPSNLIVNSHAAGTYVPRGNGRSGHLLFLRGDTLLAQSFDPSSLKLAGDPVSIAHSVGGLMLDYAGNPGFSISANGVLAYHSITGARSQLVWLDRTGKRVSAIATSDVWSHPRLSPDGRRVAFDSPDLKTGVNDLWIADTLRGSISRLTYHPALDGIPIWSPTGDRIAFNSIRQDSRNLYWKPTAGGEEKLLLWSAESKVPSDWSSDGKFLLFCQGNEREVSWDIWALPLSRDGKPFPLVQSPFNESHAQFSPDGRWIVYASDESGARELYLLPFSGGPTASSALPERIQITSGGGTQPRWRKDGRELFYMDSNSRIIALPIKMEPKVETGEPRPLFQVRGVRPFADGLYEYDVAPDGQRFLFNITLDGMVSPITVIVNWDAALR
jgi:eukaryotic-like serine/threonine-protein kinase